jgi:S1-C subfamily serine protease
MRLRFRVLVGILISLVLLNGIWVVYDIRKEIQFNKDLTQKQLKINDQVTKEIFMQLQVLNIKNKYVNTLIDEIYESLSKQIENVPEKERLIKTQIEYKLRQAVVFIYNKSAVSFGSGVTIKYKNKFYILSAGHMMDTKKDILAFGENGQEIDELEILKWDFTTPEEDEKGDYTKGTDLILLRPKNKNLIPTFYVELSESEIPPPSEVYIVGNPTGIEDVLCEGRIISYINNFVYYIDHTYFGNSGGGLFTKDGKLLGIVSHMNPINYNPAIPAYMTYGAVRLSQIQKFLEGVDE